MQMTLNTLGEKVEDLFRVLRIRISVFLIVTLRFFTVCLMPDSVDKKSNSEAARLKSFGKANAVCRCMSVKSKCVY